MSQKFFKTGPGQYGEGDVFIGLTVPKIRQFASQHRHTPVKEIAMLLRSPIHEIRLLALIMLVNLYRRSPETQREKIYRLYLKSIKKFINSWDLVDVSAPHIVGAHLQNRPKDVLYDLARSHSLWERRVAMLSTFAFIRQGSPKVALDIATLLVKDQHDLIQKAVGWMLREVGKNCSQATVEAFLEQYATSMPRTMLRYALEKFSPKRRRYFLNK